MLAVHLSPSPTQLHSTPFNSLSPTPHATMNPLLLPELIALVADYFNFDEAVSPSLVCRVWNAAFGPIVWRSYLIDAKTHTNEYSIPAMSRNAPHIRHLTCEEVSSIGQYMIPCIKLRDLTIWQDHRGELLTAVDPAVEWGRFSKLIRQNPQLNKVTISVAGRPATYDFWAAASSIARVEISNIQMDGQDIQTFWTGCKNIQELSIDSIRPIDNVEFFAGAQESIYANMRRIAVLDRMRYAPATSLIQFLGQGQSPNLTSLTMACSWLIPRSTVRSFISVLEQGCLPRLEDLTLTYNFLDTELSSCLRALAPLKRINCSWSKFGPQAMAALEPHYATLESVKLSECTQLTGNMIQKVLESCPLLTELFATDIHAPQIQRGRPWVCLGLKKLSMCVFVDSRTAKSVRKQSQAVFEQLGRLTRLEMLTVGMNKLDISPAPKFQGLDFRLESGMDQLVGMTRLEKLSFMRTKQNMSCQDVAWMRRHLRRLVMVRGRCNMYGDYREQPI